MDERDDEMMIEAIAQTLRDEPVRKLPAAFDARVMAGIRWSARKGGSGVLQWLTRPRRLQLSPLGGLAAAATFAGLAYLGALAAVKGVVDDMRVGAGVAVAPQPGDAAVTAAQVVQFVFVAPDARSVSVVGDFNDWNASATPLKLTSGNVWTVQLPLSPGRYNYVFMVDGKRLVPDPRAPLAPADELGQRTSVITVEGAAL